MTQSFERLTLDSHSGHDLVFCELEPSFGLDNGNAESASDSVSLSVCLSLCLSKINNIKKKKNW